MGPSALRIASWRLQTKGAATVHFDRRDQLTVHARPMHPAPSQGIVASGPSRRSPPAGWRSYSRAPTWQRASAPDLRGPGACWRLSPGARRA